MKVKTRAIDGEICIQHQNTNSQGKIHAGEKIKDNIKCEDKIKVQHLGLEEGNHIGIDNGKRKGVETH